MSLTALLVGTDERFARGTGELFRREGAALMVETDPRSGLEEASSGRFQVVLLDAQESGLDGPELCRALRERSDVPVVLVGARADEGEALRGYESGADDVVVKGIGPRELLARVRALVRRARGLLPRPEPIRAGALELDVRARRAALGGRELSLTRYQFELLRVLALHRGTPLSREQLMEAAKGSAEESFDRSIDVQICHLRLKLGDDSRHPRMLKTIRGYGYALAGG
ncbi:MAG TPA: response regulator transcription factor [Myxococcales bacterium]|nr:response regulator transcription factor [Myxococcales bacterium]